VSCQLHTPAALPAGKERQILFDRILSGPQSLSCLCVRVGNVSPDIRAVAPGTAVEPRRGTVRRKLGQASRHSPQFNMGYGESVESSWGGGRNVCGHSAQVITLPSQAAVCKYSYISIIFIVKAWESGPARGSSYFLLLPLSRSSP
jgi:hypothetical protein